MTCSQCPTVTVPDAIVANLTICPQCLRSLRIEADRTTPAMGADVVALTPDQLTKLRAARASARKARD